MKKYDFKNKHDFKECERLAYDGLLDYSKFPPAAYRYFSELSKLYYLYKNKKISRYDAERKKAEIYAYYTEALSAYEEWCNTCKAYQENIKKTNIIRSDICKSDSINNIADMAVKAVSVMTGDTAVYKTFREKFREVLK